MINLEHKEIEGVNFCVLPIIPFEDWVGKYGGMTKFMSLSRKDKEKIFLRWKWGFTDERVNEELELSEKATLFHFKDDNDLSSLPEPWRFHINNKRHFNRICFETKKRIGLIIEKSSIVDKVVETFDAREEQ